MNSTLPIGDFSRATHLSVKMLRHYHELGLLEPVEVDVDSGYRRYAAEQKLQVDVAGENTLAKSSAINGVARPSDGFVDIAYDDSDVIQPK